MAVVCSSTWPQQWTVCEALVCWKFERTLILERDSFVFKYVSGNTHLMTKSAKVLISSSRLSNKRFIIISCFFFKYIFENEFVSSAYQLVVVFLLPGALYKQLGTTLVYFFQQIIHGLTMSEILYIPQTLHILYSPRGVYMS